MEPDSRPLPVEMLSPIAVRALRPFELGAQQVKAGDVVTVPRHRAEYLRFLQLVEWTGI